MGEDNIEIRGYTMYYDGQLLGYVDGIDVTEDPMKDIDKYLLLNDYQKVVRCKDCKFAEDSSYDLTAKWCSYFCDRVSFMGYCAWGESH